MVQLMTNSSNERKHEDTVKLAPWGTQGVDSAAGAEGAEGGKGIPANLTLGSIGCLSLEDIAGIEVSNVLGTFFDKW